MIVSSNSAQDSEIQLLGEAKRCQAELGRLRAEVESTEEQSTSEESESEVSELRRQLLQAYNELKAAEERKYKMQHELKWWEAHMHAFTYTAVAITDPTYSI